MPPGYASALALTLVVELAVALALAPRRVRARVLATLLFANLVTHPLAWWLVAGSGHFERFWAVESAVVLTELLLLRFVVPTTLARAAALSVAANGATIALSFAL